MPKPMTQPMTQADLDGVSCQAPGCTHESHGDEIIYLRAQCHAAGMHVGYESRRGVLILTCMVCDALVSEIAVREHSYAS